MGCLDGKLNVRNAVWSLMEKLKCVGHVAGCGDVGAPVSVCVFVCLLLT